MYLAHEDRPTNIKTLGQARVKRAFRENSQPSQSYLTADSEHDCISERPNFTENAELHQMQFEIAKLKRQLQASESRFQNVIAKSGDGIVILNSKGLVSYVNSCAEYLFNCHADEILGGEFFSQLVVEIVASEMDTQIISGVGETDTYKEICVVQTEVEVIRQDRKKRLAEMRVVETEWEGEVAYLVSLRDITQRKQTEEALRQSEARLREQATKLEQALKDLHSTHTQLVHSEKMSSLGVLVAGVAHEINNPVNFISGNLSYLDEYVQKLLYLLELYQQQYPQPVKEIQDYIEEIELDFLGEDLPKMLCSMKVGVDRISEIVLSLRKFSRVDEAQMKPIKLHENIDSTLMILENRLRCQKGAVRPNIEVVKEYGEIPEVECYAGSLDQVFMNIISNAIDALEMENGKIPNPTIRIRTQKTDNNRVIIKISDNGPGIPTQTKKRIFDPFFTTKPVGKGTGLGLSISYQIVVEKHGGELKCDSEPGQGTEFSIVLPHTLRERDSHNAA